MKSIFHRFFDTWRVSDSVPTVVFIGKNHIGTICLYPSESNPFIEDYGYVRIFDNGEVWCDENLAKLVKYTDSYNEFMEFCLDIWKIKTNQKIYPNCIILASSERHLVDERISYRDFEPKNYLVE